MSGEINRRKLGIRFLSWMIDTRPPITESVDNPFDYEQITKNFKYISNLPTLKLYSAKQFYINVGTTHEPDFVQREIGRPLGALIDSSDIVCLEYEPNFKPGNQYFQVLADFAHKQKKEVVNIDMSDNIFAQTLSFSMDATSIYSGINLILDFFEDPKEKRYLRWILLSVLGYLYGSTVSIKTDLFIRYFIKQILLFKGKEYNPHRLPSMSHEVDGRNVFMTLAILKQMKVNPAKKIVSITGSTHAEAINRYLYEENGKLLLKSHIYLLLYGWLKKFGDENKYSADKK